MIEYTIIPAAPGSLLLKYSLPLLETNDESSPELSYGAIIAWRIPSDSDTPLTAILYGGLHQVIPKDDISKEMVRSMETLITFGVKQLDGSVISNNSITDEKNFDEDARALLLNKRMEYLLEITKKHD